MGRKEKLIQPIGDSFDNVVKSTLSTVQNEVARSDDFKKIAYEGTLHLGGIDNPCYVTEDGVRYIASRRLQDIFKVAEDSPDGQLVSGGRWSRFLGFSWLNSLFNSTFDRSLLKGADLKKGNTKIVGYRAELIPELCDVILKARREGKLTSDRQNIIAQQCEILSSSLAKVGIVALVDEATGYQFDRKHDALRVLLAEYIAEGMAKWMKIFPDEFFSELDRLYNNEKTTPRARPQYYGKFINTYIYDPIEDGYVKAELDQLNITDEGIRKARFHQWLTEFGRGQLTLQIGRVMGVMGVCNSMNSFKSTIKKQNSLRIWPDLFKMD